MKRAAESQLTKDDPRLQQKSTTKYSRLDNEDAGEYKMADPETLAKRTFKPLPRRSMAMAVSAPIASGVTGSVAPNSYTGSATLFVAPHNSVVSATYGNYSPGGFGPTGINQGFGNINQGFGNINQGFGNLNQGFGNINQGFGNLNQDFGNPSTYSGVGNGTTFDGTNGGQASAFANASSAFYGNTFQSIPPGNMPALQSTQPIPFYTPQPFIGDTLQQDQDIIMSSPPASPIDIVQDPVPQTQADSPSQPTDTTADSDPVSQTQPEADGPSKRSDTTADSELSDSDKKFHELTCSYFITLRGLDHSFSRCAAEAVADELFLDFSWMIEQYKATKSALDDEFARHAAIYEKARSLLPVVPR